MFRNEGIDFMSVFNIYEKNESSWENFITESEKKNDITCVNNEGELEYFRDLPKAKDKGFTEITIAELFKKAKIALEFDQKELKKFELFEKKFLLEKNKYTKKQTNNLSKDLTVHSDNYIKMMESRIEESKDIYPLESDPLYSIDEKMKSVGGTLYLCEKDSYILKSGTIKVIEKKINNENKHIVYFKLHPEKKQEIDKEIELLLGNDEVKNLLCQELCESVEIEELEKYSYQSNDGKTLDLDAKGYKIHFKGLGKLTVITDDRLGSLYNRIEIELDSNLEKGEAQKRLKTICSLLGIEEVLSNSKPEDIKKIKLMQLYRRYFPSEAYYFEASLKTLKLSYNDLEASILENTPEMKKLINEKEGVIIKDKYGRIIYQDNSFIEKLKDNGCIGFMSGLTVKEKDEKRIEKLTQLIKEGPVSGQDRRDNGLFIDGATSKKDEENNAADNVFVRMISEGLLKNKIEDFPLSGNVQILYSFELGGLASYCYKTDHYGAKNQSDPKQSSVYRGRPTLLALSDKLKEEGSDYLSNEVMIKHSIPTQYICGMILPDEETRDALIKNLNEEGLIVTDNEGNQAVHGIPLDKFFHISQTHFNINMWESIKYKKNAIYSQIDKIKKSTDPEQFLSLLKSYKSVFETELKFAEKPFSSINLMLEFVEGLDPTNDQEKKLIDCFSKFAVAINLVKNKLKNLSYENINRNQKKFFRIWNICSSSLQSDLVLSRLEYCSGPELEKCLKFGHKLNFYSIKHLMHHGDYSAIECGLKNVSKEVFEKNKKDLLEIAMTSDSPVIFPLLMKYYPEIKNAFTPQLFEKAVEGGYWQFASSFIDALAQEDIEKYRSYESGVVKTHDLILINQFYVKILDKQFKPKLSLENAFHELFSYAFNTHSLKPLYDLLEMNDLSELMHKDLEEAVNLVQYIVHFPEELLSQMSEKNDNLNIPQYLQENKKLREELINKSKNLGLFNESKNRGLKI